MRIGCLCSYREEKVYVDPWDFSKSMWAFGFEFSHFTIRSLIYERTPRSFESIYWFGYVQFGFTFVNIFSKMKKLLLHRRKIQVSAIYTLKSSLFIDVGVARTKFFQTSLCRKLICSRCSSRVNMSIISSFQYIYTLLDIKRRIQNFKPEDFSTMGENWLFVLL